jgi:hypothetical protein
MTVLIECPRCGGTGLAEPQPAPGQAAVRDAISEALDGARDCSEPGNLDRCKPCTAALDAVMDAVDTYAMAKQPAPVGTAWRLLDEARKRIDDFTRTVINVSDRPALTALARDLRERTGLDPS